MNSNQIKNKTNNYLSNDHSILQCPTSNDHSILQCPTSNDHSILQCPTSNDHSILQCPTSNDHSILQCPTAQWHKIVGWVEGFLLQHLFICISMLKKKTLYPSHNTVSYLFICISMLKKKTLYPSHNTVSYLFICISMLKKEENPLPIPQHSKLFIYLYLHVEEGRKPSTHPTTQ